MIKEYEMYYKGNDELFLKTTRKIKENIKYNNVEDIGDFFCRYYNYNHLAIEKSYCVALDDENNVIGINLNSIGNKDEHQFYYLNMKNFMDLIKSNKCIIIHNHPMCSCKPSEADLNSLNDEIEFAKSINIEIVGYIIVGEYEMLDVITGDCDAI